MQSDMNGGSVRPFLSNVSSPRGLSVDWTTGNVFYVDASGPSINVVDRNGKFKKVLIDSALGKPVDLVVQPSKG